MPLWLPTLILIPLVSVLVVDSALRLLFLIVRLTRRPDHLSVHQAAPPPSFALVIPAHNEASLIGRAMRHIRRLEYARERYQVFVVADNCTDDTAMVAAAEGAQCLERWDPANPGKGKALSWFSHQARELLQSFDAVVILDADSRVDPLFLNGLADAFTPENHAVQGYISPIAADRSPMSTLAAYSEWLDQEIDRKAKALLNWPVSFKGKGMALQPSLLSGLIPRLLTKAEDAELSLLFAREGFCRFVPAAIVYDGTPSDIAKVATQRARWLQGQWGVWKHHLPDILHLLGRGDMGQRALVFSVLLKPKALVFCLKALLLCAALAVPFAPASVGTIVAAALVGAVLVDVSYYIVGLAFVAAPRDYARALLTAPVYVIMWLWGILIALVSKEPWPRGRD